MINKVDAWQTEDGQLFLEEKEAIKHDTETKKKVEREKILKEKSEWIKEYVLKERDDESIKLEDIGDPYYGAYWGWDCNHIDNPIDKCVYVYVNGYYSDECCVFCGDPEERK